jgi:hypothetical protein
MKFKILLRKPAGYLPFAASGAALLVIAGHMVLFGTGRRADEGAAAHLWQMLILAQLLLMAFFGLRWLPREPVPAIALLALQLLGFALALAPVVVLRW